LRTLVGLVAFLMALEACHGCSLLKLLHHVLRLSCEGWTMLLPFNLAKPLMNLSTSCLSSSFSLAIRSSHDSTTTFS
jgi:hypothetical protein